MTQLKGPFAKPDRRRGVVLATRLSLGAIVVGGLIFLAMSNQRCYKLLHGLSRIECHPATLSAQTLEAVVEQTLKGAFADRCERPMHDCIVYVDAVVKKSGEQCGAEISPEQNFVRFEIQEKAYCDESVVGLMP